MSTARPTLIERLQAQVVKLEREAEFLRRVDASMKLQLQRAIADAEALRKTNAAQAETLRDLRTQLGQRALELELVRAELQAEKAARPAPAPAPAAAPAPAKEEEQQPATRWNQMEID